MGANEILRGVSGRCFSNRNLQSTPGSGRIGGNGFTGFDFYRLKCVGTGFYQGVDFVAFLVAQEMEGWLDAPVFLRFEEFDHDPVFKQGSSLRMGADVSGSTHTEKPGGKAGFTEIELGGLDKAFVEIGKLGTDEKYKVTGLEHGQLGLRSDAGDAGVRRERRDVEQLPDTTGAEVDETLESGEILDVKDLSNIPLQISADLVLKPEGGLDLAVMDRQKETCVEKCVHGGRSTSCSLQFCQREWK